MKKLLVLALVFVMALSVCACGDAAETAAPAEDTAPAADAAPAAEGAPSGEMMNNQSGEFEITVDGVTGTASYEDTDSGDQTTKTFAVTWQGVEMTGSINAGVWTADDAANQAVIDAVHEAFEANNGGSMGPSGEQ